MILYFKYIRIFHPQPLGRGARGCALVGVLWLKGSARKAGSWDESHLRADGCGFELCGSL